MTVEEERSTARKRMDIRHAMECEQLDALTCRLHDRDAATSETRSQAARHKSEVTLLALEEAQPRLIGAQHVDWPTRVLIGGACIVSWLLGYGMHP